MTKIKLLEKYEQALGKQSMAEACENVDPNRQNADFERIETKKWRKKVLDRMRDE